MKIPNSRCKQCQLENNKGTCDKFDCANYTGSFIEPNNIQTIIDKFKNTFGLNGLHAKPVEYMDYEDVTDKAEQFLKDSLTSMLDGIKDSLPNTTNSNIIGRDREIYDLGATDYKKEVINIINSHR